MKHLYSIVFVLVALTSSHLATAQIIPNVTYTNDNTLSCSGTANAAPTGGIIPYNYQWSNGATSSSINNLCAGSYSVLIVDANQDSVYYDFIITNPCSNLTLSVNVIDCTPGNCDGSVTFMPNGGTPPYIYSIGGGPQSPVSPITNLCSGNYPAYCIDATGCTATTTVIVNDPCTNFTSTLSSTNSANSAACDGTITFNVIGGTAPFTYEFDNAFTQSSNFFDSICAGSHVVICFDANGCIRVETTTIINLGSTPILPNLTTTNDLNGNCTGSASVTPTGGAGGYSYQWSTGETTSSISNLCPGNYYVVIMDALLDTVSTNFTITNPCSNIALSAAATNCTPGNCDGTVQVTVTGGSGPYAFSLSGGPQTGQSLFSGLCPGTYTVTVADQNGCMTSSIVVVTGDPFSIHLETIGDLTGNCVGEASVAATGGLSPYTYLWSTGETTPLINNLCIGTYSVTVWGANGTDSVSASFNITNPCPGFSGYFTTTNASAPGVCDGSTMFTPFGGTPPYNFHWDNGISGASIYDLCPGTYTVMCEDSNLCIITPSVTITDSTITISNLSATISATDDLTNNCSGFVSVSPAGGIAPYYILWNNGLSGTGISGLCAGIYSVTVWDSGSDSTTIDFIIADSSTTYGNNPYPNGPFNDTLYTDLVTNCIIDYSAIDSASLYQAVYDSISQNLYVTWVVYSPTDTVYISDTLGLAGLAPGYYALTISVYCPNKSGNDFFKIEQVVYFDGSQVWMSTLNVTENALDNISIYPNPFTNSISIDNRDGIIQSVKLIDLNGRALSEMKVMNSGMVKMEQLESISSGTYFLVLSAENSSRTFKVTK